MTIERSHGKARPTLPRSSDLPDLSGTARERGTNHDALGRAAVGNRLAEHRGVKQAIKRQMGRADVTDPELAQVVADARRVFNESIKEMPSDGVTVRALVAARARHESLSAYYNAKAMEAGLLTEQGLELDARASLHSTRAERLAVTAIDIAGKMSRKKPADEEQDLATIIESGVPERFRKRKDADE